MGARLRVDGGVVVGYDGSGEAYAALCWALDEARYRDLPLHVVRAWTISSALHQVDHPYGVVPSAEELAEGLEAATRAELAGIGAAGVQVQVHLRHGPAIRTLLDAAEGADLLVVGHRGGGGWVGLRLGSSAEQVVRHAPCSVVVVRPPRSQRQATA